MEVVFLSKNGGQLSESKLRLVIVQLVCEVLDSLRGHLSGLVIYNISAD